MIRCCVVVLLSLVASSAYAELHVVATVQPLAEIVRGVAGNRAAVQRMLPPGVSPHTYSPKPSDMKAVDAAQVVFWVGAGVDDWAAKLPHSRKISLFELLPQSLRVRGEAHHDHEEHGEEPHEETAWDAHFWMDPQAVKAVLPGLVKALSDLDAAGRGEYESNAARFSAELDALDAELAALLSPIKGKTVVSFHPSMLYLIKRYGLVDGGSIEPFPGKEPTPQYLKALQERLRSTGTKAIFTEPTLPPGPGRVLAEAAGVKLSELDGMGGQPGRETLREILLYNARQLAEALQ